MSDGSSLESRRSSVQPFEESVDASEAGEAERGFIFKKSFRESGVALGLEQGLLMFSMKGLSLPPMPGDRYGESSGMWKESTGESTLHSSSLSLEVSSPYSGAFCDTKLTQSGERAPRGDLGGWFELAIYLWRSVWDSGSPLRRRDIQ